jgi:DNA-binding response OmpR family regulator
MPGAGCRIRFYIPESEGAVATREKGILPLAKKSEHRGTAVLVEDEPLLRDITARHLRFLGFTVIEAERGEEVFEILRLSPGVNLLVTDVIMPKISGPAMVRELERSGLLRGIGVIFISGYSSDELARYGIDSAALLEKPFTMDELSKAIDRVMIPRKDVANA